MKKRFKAIIAIMMVLVMSVAFFACSKKEEEPAETTTESTTVYIPPTNPFTGNEISETADGKRPVAIVVENHPDARPQWGISSADIVDGRSRTWLMPVRMLYMIWKASAKVFLFAQFRVISR